jgi:AraC-like DNA-binding protein
MSVVFRADAEPVTSRRDYWQHVLAETFGRIDVRMAGGLDSADRLRVGDVGAVSVTDLSISKASIAERAARHIRSSDPEVYKIDLQARGRGVVEQGGRQARQAPGDFTFVDLSRPCRWISPSSRLLAVVFPRSLVPLRAEELARLSGVRVPGDRGIGALVSALARQLPKRIDDCSAADQARLGTAVLDLVTAALAAQLDRAGDVPPESRQRALVLRIHAFIEERLGDPHLSPTTIAAAHYISVRYLHKLFETEQTSVADWIRRRRLERSRRDLLDPALRHEPVSTIGARWGFTSPSHFSRTFRAAHGLPPVEYRETGLRAGSS